jgi:hypothetical protein
MVGALAATRSKAMHIKLSQAAASSREAGSCMGRKAAVHRFKGKT